MLSSSSSASRRIQEEKENPPLTGMNLRFQLLKERIIAERTTTSTCTNTQLRVPSIIDLVGCDITLEDIQVAKQEMITNKFDLKKDVNENQNLPFLMGTVTPLHHFCATGELLIVKLLFLIGADFTKICEDGDQFPMLVAAQTINLDICKWLFEYVSDAKYQINKETTDGYTPLGSSYLMWRIGVDKEGKTCRWLLLNGGGQHLSSETMSHFYDNRGKERKKSNLLVLWTRENIQLYNTFILLLCGATTMIASSSSLSSSSSSSSESSHGGTNKRERKMHPKRSLQILDGYPGIMESIGDYAGVIRGKEIRMLKEFNESVMEHMTDEKRSNDDDDDNNNTNNNGEDEDEE